MRRREEDEQRKKTWGGVSGIGAALGKKLRDARFARKIYLAFLVMACITVLPLGIFSYFQAYDNLIDQEKRNAKEQIWQANTVLEGQIQQYQTVITSLLYNMQLRSCLTMENIGYYDQYLMFSDIMEPVIGGILSANPNVLVTRIYTNNRTLEGHSHYLYVLEDMPGYQEEETFRSLTFWAEENRLATVCQFPRDGSGLTHVLYTEFRIGDTLDMFLDKGYELQLSDKAGGIVYQSPGWPGAGELLSEEFGRIQLGGREYYALTQEIRDAGWVSTCLIPVETLKADSMGILQATGVHFLWAALAAVFMSSLLGRWLVDPMKELQEDIHQVEEGNFSLDIRSESKDEIGQLTNAFGAMTKRLNVLVNEVYKNKIIRQEAEFKMLQAQLNPHFLYNTLSFINWSALRAGEKEIAKISRDISTFYRTALNTGKTVTSVEEELRNAKSYVDIQLALHHDGFDVAYEVDEECLSYQVMCNILQPLIENALEHGIDKKRDGRGRLEITVGREEELLLLSVSDNGPGFGEEEQKKALQMETSGYGLKSVNERIRLYYGEAYGLSISGQEGETRIGISLPL